MTHVQPGSGSGCGNRKNNWGPQRDYCLIKDKGAWITDILGFKEKKNPLYNLGKSANSCVKQCRLFSESNWEFALSPFSGGTFTEPARRRALMENCTEQTGAGHADSVENADEFIFICVSKASLYWKKKFYLKLKCVPFRKHYPMEKKWTNTSHHVTQRF